MQIAKLTSTQTGGMGERLVAEELVRRGFTVIECNWKTKYAEIDIVSKQQNIICFVEVKFRKSAAQGDGFDYITNKKLWHMQRAAELWVAVHAWDGEYRLFGASVVGETSEVDIREIA